MNATREMLSPVSPGAQAPDFALPAVDGSGTISLQDYRGKSPVVPGAVRRAVVSVLPPLDRRDGGDGAGAEGAGRRDALRRGHAAGECAALFQVSARRACGWRPIPSSRRTAPMACPSPRRRPSS